MFRAIASVAWLEKGGHIMTCNIVSSECFSLNVYVEMRESFLCLQYKKKKKMKIHLVTLKIESARISVKVSGIAIQEISWVL